MLILLISAAIEEDYAKRLSKLSRLPLGKDEVGYVVIFSSLMPWDVARNVPSLLTATVC